MIRTFVMIAVMLTAVSVSPVRGEAYAGQAPDAPWRAAAAARIDEHRKADLRLRLVDDQTGEPAAFQRVTVRMTRHAFPFTIAHNAPGIADTEGDKGPQNRLATGGLFNTLKGINAKVEIWSGANQAAYSSGLRDFLATGMDFRGGHVMYRRRELFDGLQDQPLADAILKTWGELSDTRVADGRTLGQITLSWDVLNEPYGGGDVYPHLSSRGDETERRARVATFLKRADQWRRQGRLHPEARFIVNEARVISQPGISNTSREKGDRRDYYFRLLKDLIDQGAPFEAIGFQGHQSQDLPGMQDVWDTLERFASLGKELMITEYDIKIRGDYAQSHDEQQVMALEAQYTRDFMTLVFSHPQVTTFDVWQIYDPRHWKGNALFLADGEEDGGLAPFEMKPSGQVFADLVLGEWWTQRTLLSDHAGDVRLRGLLGEYEVLIDRAGQAARVEAVLRPDGLFTRDGQPIAIITTQGRAISQPLAATEH